MDGNVQLNIQVPKKFLWFWGPNMPVRYDESPRTSPHLIYTITLNQSHYGILVYSGRCRTLDRSCPQFNCVCVFSWLNLHDKQTCLSLPSASLPGRVLSANQSLAWESRSAYSSALFAEELQGNPTAKPPSWLGFCVFLVLRVSNLWRE